MRNRILFALAACLAACNSSPLEGTGAAATRGDADAGPAAGRVAEDTPRLGASPSHIEHALRAREEHAVRTGLLPASGQWCNGLRCPTPGACCGLPR